jgi:hypothetical protein
LAAWQLVVHEVFAALGVCGAWHPVQVACPATARTAAFAAWQPSHAWTVARCAA